MNQRPRGNPAWVRNLTVGQSTPNPRLGHRVFQDQRLLKGRYCPTWSESEPSCPHVVPDAPSPLGRRMREHLGAPKSGQDLKPQVPAPSLCRSPTRPTILTCHRLGAPPCSWNSRAGTGLTQGQQCPLSRGDEGPGTHPAFPSREWQKDTSIGESRPQTGWPPTGAQGRSQLVVEWPALGGEPVLQDAVGRTHPGVMGLPLPLGQLGLQQL